MDKDDDLELLKKPVHAAILKPSHIQDLQNRGILKGGGVIKSVPTQELPKKEEKRKRERFNPLSKMNLKDVTKPARQVSKRTKLRVLYDNLPPTPEDKKAPCDECKTSACCYAFVVAITKDEYESGMFDPYAVKLDPKYMKQLQGKGLLVTTLTSPVVFKSEDTEYYLEGKIGEPCPFLEDDGRCGIYEDRPLTCRIYTCVDDERITQAIRDGDEWFF